MGEKWKGGEIAEEIFGKMKTPGGKVLSGVSCVYCLL